MQLLSPRSFAALVAVCAVGLLAAPTAGAMGLEGLPSGAPKAATAAEPTLPAPAGWPFFEGFPRTSGTSRLYNGSLQSTDFVYDDHGAVGTAVGTLNSTQHVASLAPFLGSYVYPTAAAHGDGADIFRSGIGLSRSSTYWRIDWNTLTDPNVPIAEWALDTDASASTGSSAWPAGAGVSSPGIDRAILVSSRGAWLIDVASGKRTNIVTSGGRLTVDRAARSFIVRIPRSVLPAAGKWKVRLAAGVASADGTGFAAVSPQDGALPGEPNVYNVAYRSVTQEGSLVCPESLPLPTEGHVPVVECANNWNENAQAEALVSGDVSKFSIDVDFAQLAAKQTAPEPLPRGYSVRWYVSRLDLGNGVVPDASGNVTGDLRPNFLGRIQPYTVYVPKSYDPAKPTPLTWVLHSLGVNHNQYVGTAPSLIQEACEQRHSICATTLGYGADGWYFDEAEVDFWQVWNALARSYTLDPDSTVISGYSMGGFATYKLGLGYPDLFAGTMSLEGPPGCGLRLSQTLAVPGGSGHCSADGNTTALVGNALWLPFTGTYGFIDELVPITSGLEQVTAFENAGIRTRFVIYPAEDHLVFAVQNDFSPLTTKIGAPRRVINPGHVHFSWFPDLVVKKFGIGPTGAYWVRGLSARTSSPGRLATVDAKSLAIPEAPVTPHETTSELLEFHPTPALVREQTWALGTLPSPSRELDLRLADVGRMTVDMRRAKLRCGPIAINSDGPATLGLSHLRSHLLVRSSGQRARHTDRNGHVSFNVPTGDSTATVACHR